jgi:hypothetical protein
MIVMAVSCRAVHADHRCDYEPDHAGPHHAVTTTGEVWWL